MPRMGRGWKEAGFDTSPPRPPVTSRKVWLEMYVGRCVMRLNVLKAQKKMDPKVREKLRAWMLDPDWLR